jgi:hypothetical protein
LEAAGFFKTGRVHIIDPNIRSHVVPINLLAGLDDTDVSVLADALLQAVERVWGDEDTHQKPAIRSNLKAAFMALAELGLPLTDAKLLFDPDDTHGVRTRTIGRLANEYAHDELTRLHRIALADRTRREFNLEVRGPINRLNEFVSSEAMRAMLGVVDEPGGTRRTLDILECMEKGHILLVNLQHGGAVSEADTDLLGALLLRYLFLLASRRTNREPFPIYVDECHRFLTGDVPNILAESRKYGIACHLAHQFLAQLGKPDDLVYQALHNSTEIKVVFRVKSPQEAQQLAEMVIPLDLERPLAASVRPTVIGHRRARLASAATTESEAITESEGETMGEMSAHTDMHSLSEAFGNLATTMTGAGSFEGGADSTGMVLAPPVQLFGPNAPNASFIQYPLSESIGQLSSHGQSLQSAESTGTSHLSAESHGTAETRASSHAASRNLAHSRGTARTTGESEAFEPVYQDLPSTWHSLESERYRAGELIRALPPGRAFVSWRGKTACITIPQAKYRS